MRARRAISSERWILRVPQQAVFDGDVGLGADEDVGVSVLRVAEEVEGGDDGAVAAVFKGDDAAVGGAGLDGGEDVGDGDLGGERGLGWGEGVEGGLGVVR